MGGGASSLIRLRKALVIRAYNLRKAELTLDEQFRPHAIRQNGVLYIRLEDVNKALSVDSNGAWMEDLFKQIMVDGSKDKRMRFHDFLEFLETGKVVPVEVVDTNLIENSSSSSAACGDNELPPTISSVNYNSSMSNLLAANNKFNDSTARSTNAKVDRALQISSGPPTAVDHDAPPFPPSEADSNSPKGSPTSNHTPQQVIVELSDTMPKTLKPTESMEIIPKGYHKMTVPTDAEDKIVKPLWKKREVMKQERTIHYTTVDATGAVQELVEKEVSETEVLHMECRETGEFAHRETTLYEQKETFNDEIVNEQFGTEEYVHMKSQEDEYEFRDSNMPPRGGGPPESAPMSPEGHGHGHGGEGDGEHNTGGAGRTPKTSPGGDGIAHKNGDYDSDGESIRATATDTYTDTGGEPRQQQHPGGSFSPEGYGRHRQQSGGFREELGSDPELQRELSHSGDEEDLHAFHPDIDAGADGAGGGVGVAPDSYRGKYKRSNAGSASDISDSTRSSGAPTPSVDIGTGVGAYLSGLDIGADGNSSTAKSSKPKRSGSGVRFTCDDETDTHGGSGRGNVDNYAGVELHETHEIPNSPERKQKLSSLFTDSDCDDVGGCASSAYVHNDGSNLGDNSDLLGLGGDQDQVPSRGGGSSKIPMSPKIPRSPKGTPGSSYPDLMDIPDAPPLIRQSSSMHEID